ncbi:MAG: hypothetical protein D3912_04775 [Candidatus Electrothrix sp. AX1]|nr:hypothetical protein [Candidatus Electrothrix sp. AX1]
MLITQQTLFDFEALPTTLASATSPAGYKGLAAFHKYWGKKPIEPLLLLIERLTKQGDTVLDPFLGGGLLARATVLKKRRFIGLDINPCAVELGTLFLDLPSSDEFAEVFAYLKDKVAAEINSSYLRANASIASHYLWDDNQLKMVWEKNGRRKIEYSPDDYDVDGINIYKNYNPKYIRPLTMFQNSRINSREGMGINDLFTGRALRNIDLLLENILSLPEKLRRAFLLTLTSASGQMSNMVFAISRRGKSNGKSESSRIEVGSWAIGFWCPKQHFEINCWNCFSNRASRFIKTLRKLPAASPSTLADTVEKFNETDSSAVLVLDSAMNSLQKIASGSISLILTDPPHSDRVPYLELSDFWNAILQYPVSTFNEEIVISNAKGRGKDAVAYHNSMHSVMKQCVRILQPNGTLCLQFNTKDGNGWRFLRSPPEGLVYSGCFPLHYSARSLVQDNRKGAMKHDYALIYKRSNDSDISCMLEDIPGWTTEFPKKAL